MQKKGMKKGDKNKKDKKCKKTKKGKKAKKDKKDDDKLEKLEKDMKKGKMKKETVEEDGFLSSLNNMMSDFSDVGNWDGVSVEEMELTKRIEPDTDDYGVSVGAEQPGPGEVGYAPQSRIGS
jgi:hypothetical protein